MFVIADSDTGYVHSIIPYFGKLTGDFCNWPYSEKPFTSRIAPSLMYKLWPIVSGVGGYHIVVFSWPNNWTIKNSTQQPLTLLVELAIQNHWDKGPWRKWKVATSYKSRNVLMMDLKDKKTMFMMSTYSDTPMKKWWPFRKGAKERTWKATVCMCLYKAHG